MSLIVLTKLILLKRITLQTISNLIYYTPLCIDVYYGKLFFKSEIDAALCVPLESCQVVCQYPKEDNEVWLGPVDTRPALACSSAV
jgi:hypothetical protein